MNTEWDEVAVMDDPSSGESWDDVAVMEAPSDQGRLSSALNTAGRSFAKVGTGSVEGILQATDNPFTNPFAAAQRAGIRLGAKLAGVPDEQVEFAERAVQDTMGNAFRPGTALAEQVAKVDPVIEGALPTNPAYQGEWMADKIPSVLGQVTGQLASALIPAKYAGLSGRAISALGLGQAGALGMESGAEEAERLGIKDQTKKDLLASLYGGVEAGTEAFGGFGTKAYGDTLASGIKALFNPAKGAKAAVKRFATTTLGEGREEAVAAPLQDTLSTLFNENGAPVDTPAFTSDYLKKVGESFALGAIGGGVFGGVEALQNSRRSRIQNAIPLYIETKKHIADLQSKGEPIPEEIQKNAVALETYVETKGAADAAVYAQAVMDENKEVLEAIEKSWRAAGLPVDKIRKEMEDLKAADKEAFQNEIYDAAEFGRVLADDTDVTGAPSEELQSVLKSVRENRVAQVGDPIKQIIAKEETNEEIRTAEAGAVAAATEVGTATKAATEQFIAQQEAAVSQPTGETVEPQTAEDVERIIQQAKAVAPEQPAYPAAPEATKTTGDVAKGAAAVASGQQPPGAMPAIIAQQTEGKQIEAPKPSRPAPLTGVAKGASIGAPGSEKLKRELEGAMKVIAQQKGVSAPIYAEDTEFTTSEALLADPDFEAKFGEKSQAVREGIVSSGLEAFRFNGKNYILTDRVVVRPEEISEAIDRKLPIASVALARVMMHEATHGIEKAIQSLRSKKDLSTQEKDVLRQYETISARIVSMLNLKDAGLIQDPVLRGVIGRYRAAWSRLKKSEDQGEKDRLIAELVSEYFSVSAETIKPDQSSPTSLLGKIWTFLKGLFNLSRNKPITANATLDEVLAFLRQAGEVVGTAGSAGGLQASMPEGRKDYNESKRQYLQANPAPEIASMPPDVAAKALQDYAIKLGQRLVHNTPGETLVRIGGGDGISPRTTVDSQGNVSVQLGFRDRVHKFQGMEHAALQELLYDTVEEEVIHAAELAGLRSRWGGRGDFLEHPSRLAGSTIEEIRFSLPAQRSVTTPKARTVEPKWTTADFFKKLSQVAQDSEGVKLIPVQSPKWGGTATALARELGLKVRWFKASQTFKGAMDVANRTIWLNSTMESTAVPQVVAHEAFHQMRSDRPDLYEETLDQVLSMLDMTSVQEWLTSAGYDPDSLDEESVAYLVGDFAQEPEFWDKLFSNNKGLGSRVLQYLIDAINKIIKKLDLGKVRNSSEAYNAAPEDMDYILNVLTDKLRQWQTEGIAQPAKQGKVPLAVTTPAKPTSKKYGTKNRDLDTARGTEITSRKVGRGRARRIAERNGEIAGAIEKAGIQAGDARPRFQEEVYAIQQVLNDLGIPPLDVTTIFDVFIARDLPGDDIILNAQGDWKKLGVGFEGAVLKNDVDPKKKGYVYKFYAPLERPTEEGMGIVSSSKIMGGGAVSEPMLKVVQVLGNAVTPFQKAAVITGIGGIPMELQGMDDDGIVVYKMPLATAPNDAQNRYNQAALSRALKGQIIDKAWQDQTRKDLLEEDAAEAQQAAEDHGLLPVGIDEGVALPQKIKDNGAYITALDGKVYLLTDVRMANVLLDNKKKLRISDAAVSEIPKTTWEAVPKLKPVAEKALADEAARKTPRSDLQFSIPAARWNALNENNTLGDARGLLPQMGFNESFQKFGAVYGDEDKHVFNTRNPSLQDLDKMATILARKLKEWDEKPLIIPIQPGPAQRIEGLISINDLSKMLYGKSFLGLKPGTKLNEQMRKRGLIGKDVVSISTAKDIVRESGGLVVTLANPDKADNGQMTVHARALHLLGSRSQGSYGKRLPEIPKINASPSIVDSLTGAHALGLTSGAESTQGRPAILFLRQIGDSNQMVAIDSESGGLITQYPLKATSDLNKAKLLYRSKTGELGNSTRPDPGIQTGKTPSALSDNSISQKPSEVNENEVATSTNRGPQFSLPVRSTAQGGVSPDEGVRRDAIKSGVERLAENLGAVVRWTVGDTEPQATVGTEKDGVTLVAPEAWLDELSKLPADEARVAIEKRRALLILEAAANASAPKGNRESLAVRTWSAIRQAYRESEEGKQIVAVALETLRGKPFQTPAQRGRALADISYDLNLGNTQTAKDFINHILRLTMERFSLGPISEHLDGMFDGKPMWEQRVKNTLAAFGKKVLDGGFGPEFKDLFDKAEQLIKASKPAMDAAVPDDPPVRPVKEEKPEPAQSPGQPTKPEGATSPGPPTRDPRPEAQPTPIAPTPPVAHANWDEDWARDFLKNEARYLKEKLADPDRPGFAPRVVSRIFIPAGGRMLDHQRTAYTIRLNHAESVARAARILGLPVPAKHAAFIKNHEWRRRQDHYIQAYSQPWMSILDFERSVGNAVFAPFVEAKKAWDALSGTERAKRMMLTVMEVADRSRDAAVFAKNLVSRLGKWIREHAPKLWEAAKDSTGKAVMRFLEKIGAMKFAMPLDVTTLQREGIEIVPPAEPSEHAVKEDVKFTGKPTPPPFLEAELVGTCVSEQQINDAFGSLDEFEQLVKENGDEFTSGGVSVTYNPRTHEHFFWEKPSVKSGPQFSLPASRDYARHAELESKHNAGTITPEEAAEAQRIVDKARLLPRRVTYLGDVEVIRNPSDSDYRQLNSAYRNEYPFDRSGDPSTRFTTDANGNRWIWRSDKGIHSQIEPLISKNEGGRVVGQNESNWNPDASDPFTGVPLEQRFTPESDDIRFSLPASREDAEYMAAVQRGDMETAQKMVDEAAKRAGYTAEAWQGADKDYGPIYKKGRFNSKIRSEDDRNNFGFYFAHDELTASRYLPERGGVLRHVWLKMANPLDLSSMDGFGGEQIQDAINEAGVKFNFDGYEDPEVWRNLKDGDKALASAIKKAGYDGVLFNEFFFGKETPVTVVFSPSQIKSADPVAYDNQGNIIPLSQRFNKASDDIRFSLPARSRYNRENRMSDDEFADYTEGLDPEKYGPMLEFAQFMGAPATTRYVREGVQSMSDWAKEYLMGVGGGVEEIDPVSGQRVYRPAIDDKAIAAYVKLADKMLKNKRFAETYRKQFRAAQMATVPKKGTGRVKTKAKVFNAETGETEQEMETGYDTPLHNGSAAVAVLQLEMMSIAARIASTIKKAPLGSPEWKREARKLELINKLEPAANDTIISDYATIRDMARGLQVRSMAVQGKGFWKAIKTIKRGMKAAAEEGAKQAGLNPKQVQEIVQSLRPSQIFVAVLKEAASDPTYRKVEEIVEEAMKSDKAKEEAAEHREWKWWEEAMAAFGQKEQLILKQLEEVLKRIAQRSKKISPDIQASLSEDEMTPEELKAANEADKEEAMRLIRELMGIHKAVGPQTTKEERKRIKALHDASKEIQDVFSQSDKDAKRILASEKARHTKKTHRENKVRQAFTAQIKDPKLEDKFAEELKDLGVSDDLAAQVAAAATSRIEEEAEADENDADKVAQKIIDRIDRQHTEWVPADKKLAHEVERIKKAALVDARTTATDEAPMTRERFVEAYEASLKEAGVSDEIAHSLANRLYDENVKLAANKVNDKRVKAAGSARFMNKLVEQILETPSLFQDAASQEEAVIDAFMSAGLTEAEAKIAATNLRQTINRLRIKAADKAIEIAGKKMGLKKKTMEHIRMANRVGLTDPSDPVSAGLAAMAGFKGLTLDDHKKIAIQDAIMQTGTPSEQAKAHAEILRILTAAGLPKGLIEVAMQAWVTSAISGTSNLGINALSGFFTVVRNIPARLFSILDDRMRGKITKPQARALALKTFTSFSQGLDEALAQLKFAGKHDAYKSRVAEHISEAASLAGEARRNAKLAGECWKAGKYREAVTAGMKAFWATTDALRRVLSTLDQSWSSAIARYTLENEAMRSMFTEAGLEPKDAWAIQRQAMALAEESLKDRLEARKELGEPEADAYMKEAMRQDLIQMHVVALTARAAQDKGKDPQSVRGKILETATKEGDLEIGNYGSEKGAGFDIFNHMIEAVKRGAAAMRREPGAEGNRAAMISLLGRFFGGFVAVPANVLNRSLYFTPWGIARALYRLNQFKQGKAMEDRYTQTMGTERQAAIRLWESILGSLVMIAYAALNGDDDDQWITVTGAGPSDPKLRDAWQKKGHRQNSIEVKTPGGGFVSVPYGRGGFEGVFFALAPLGAINDMQLNGIKDADKATMFGRYMNAMKNVFASQARFLTAKQTGEAFSSSSTSEKQLAGTAVYSLSPFVPGSGLIKSIIRMAGEDSPLDQSGVATAMWASSPVAGWGGTVKLNALGDPIGDQSTFNRTWFAGFPFAYSDAKAGPDDKAYSFFLKTGIMPTPPSRSILETRNQKLLTDQQWDRYVKTRGRLIKSAIREQVGELSRMDSKDAEAAIEKISADATKQTKGEMGLK